MYNTLNNANENNYKPRIKKKQGGVIVFGIQPSNLYLHLQSFTIWKP